MNRILITSFGYLHGIPPVADITIDVRRHLRDPHVDPEFRQLTGLDPTVRRRVLATPGATGLIEGVALILVSLVPVVKQERSVRAAIGCAGGRHRSVVIANEITAAVIERGWLATVEHRDIEQPVVTR
jgi:UPF0042 nucleotide-binding protein